MSSKFPPASIVKLLNVAFENFVRIPRGFALKISVGDKRRDEQRKGENG